MNEPDHGVYTEIQPAQLMSLPLAVGSGIGIKEGNPAQYCFVMGWANIQLDKDSVRHYDATGRYIYI